MKILPFLILPLFSFSQDFAISGTAYMYKDSGWIEMPVENIIAMSYENHAPLFVGDVDINDPENDVHYIEVVLPETLKGYIDIGDGATTREMRGKEIKDGDGNAPGPGRMGAFNFLGCNGWEFVQIVGPDAYLFIKKQKN